MIDTIRETQNHKKLVGTRIQNNNQLHLLVFKICPVFALQFAANQILFGNKLLLASKAIAITTSRLWATFGVHVKDVPGTTDIPNSTGHSTTDINPSPIDLRFGRWHHGNCTQYHQNGKDDQCG